MTPLESHEGVLVKREDLHHTGYPSGKLRGLLPYLERLRAQGCKTVVNAGATHSNSHAIVAFAARLLGLGCHTFVNSDRHHPATLAAQAHGATVHLLRPMHLGPLRSKAARWASENDATPLAWGLAVPDVIRAYAYAVCELPPMEGAVHVVPFGAGGWAAGVWYGLRQQGRYETVLAVPVMPTAGDKRRLLGLLGAVAPLQTGLGVVPASGPYPDLPDDIRLGAACPAPTRWPSDPRYEHQAWGTAKMWAHNGHRVVFWSIGQPCY